MKRIQLRGYIPIPVGHRVEVVWYQQESTKMGLFGGAKIEVTELEDPVVTDHTTGIRYSTLTHVSDGHSYSSNRINAQSHTLRADLSPVRTLAGTVRSCSIVDIRFPGQWPDGVETQLEVEEG